MTSNIQSMDDSETSSSAPAPVHAPKMPQVHEASTAPEEQGAEPQSESKTVAQSEPPSEPPIELPTELPAEPKTEAKTEEQFEAQPEAKDEPKVESPKTVLPKTGSPRTGSPTAPAPIPQLSTFPSELEIGTDSDQSNRDDDSTRGESIADSTMSLRSSIFDYFEENGRTYHAYNSGKYMLPNDEREQDRLDLQHHSFKIMLDGNLHMAPLSNPQRVLDLATGTGIWAIEFAQQFEAAIVTGTDLSPIQPDYVPPNCRFEVDDAEDEWTYNEPFDYIHARAIVTCFKSNRAMAQKIFDNLAPGGYFELQDPCLPMISDDGSLDGTPLGEWNSLLVESMARIGRNLRDSQNWGQYLRDVGFEDVTEKRVYVPVNPWARGKKNKLLGAISNQNMSEGIASLSTAAFTRILGWSQQQLEVFLVGVRDNLSDKNIHAYGTVYFVYGRKPA